GQEMIQRLLFDRVDAEAARAAVRKEPDLTALDATHEAQATLSLVHLACARTDVALNAPIVRCMPVLGRVAHGMSEKVPVVFTSVQEYRLLRRSITVCRRTLPRAFMMRQSRSNASIRPPAVA